MPRTQTRHPFAERLRLALQEAEITQEALAREVGVSLGAVQRWVAGRSEPKARQLVRIAEALDRDPRWFFEEPGAAAA